MAIKRLFRQNLVEEALNSFSNVTNNASSIEQNAKLHFETVYKQLQNKELRLFSALGVADTKQLAQKINNIIYGADSLNKGLENLTGQNLYKFIGPAQSASDEKKDERLKWWSTIISQYVEDQLHPAIEEVLLDKPEQLVIDLLRKYRSKGEFGEITGASKAVRSIRGISYEVIGGKLVFHFDPKHMTTKVQELVKQFADKRSPLPEIEIQEGENWATITEFAKPSESKELTNKEEIFDKLTDYIVQIAHIQNHDFPIKIKQLLKTRLPDNTFAGDSVFVGENIKNGITGILGEIRAYYVMASLFPNRSISFEATTRLNGKYSSRDLVMIAEDEEFGMQVKNTSQDLEQDWATTIDFMSRVTTGDSKGLFSAMNLDNDSADIIAQIFLSHAFNIEYQFVEGVYQSGDNQVFKPTRLRLEEAYYKANELLSKYADSFMFMETGEMMEDYVPGNVLWFVGNKIISATQILDHLRDQLTDRTRFLVKGSYRIGDSNKNIVDYLNNQKAQAGLNPPEILDAGTLELKSSFVFDKKITY